MDKSPELPESGVQGKKDRHAPWLPHGGALLRIVGFPRFTFPSPGKVVAADSGDTDAVDALKTAVRRRGTKTYFFADMIF